MVEISVDGPEEIASRLDNLVRGYPTEGKNAMWLEMAKVMNEALRLCPVDTGYLRGSRVVEEPSNLYDGTIMATIGFSAEYAYWVHELTGNYHNPPTQAKFLEVPLLKALPTLAEKVADRIEWLLTNGWSEDAVASLVEKATKPPKG